MIIQKKFLFVSALLLVGLMGVTGTVSHAASGAIAPNRGVVLSVMVDGSAPFTYQWYKDGAVITGATADTYLISAMQAINAGVYYSVISNPVGSTTSDNLTLSLGYSPAIITQPISQTVTAGTSVTFTATASGSPAPTFQWKFNGSSIAGETNVALTLVNAQAVNAGDYTWVATNTAGSVTSTVATLTVNAVVIAPVITTQPLSQSVTAGTRVAFIVAASGTPAPAYQWSKEGINIAGATGASYVLASPSSGDAGTYRAVATNSVGSATSNAAVLTVNRAPVISAQPVTQTVTKGSTVTFKVTASGSASFTYQWRKNGSRISRATGASYVITGVAAANAGTYTVVVTNAFGSVTSAAALLTVKAATAPAVYRVDFNGDGQSDLLWQNSTTGECSVWLLSGTAVSNKISLGTGPAGLKICGTGDFNADGKTDILWQNSTTGEPRVWLMAGTTLVSDVSFGSAAPHWQLRGSGDFNGDGKSDLVWQHNQTGECSVWLMNGTAVSGVLSLGLASVDLVITGTGDFNKDGQSDLLWQNSATGEFGVWLMAGATVSSSVSLGTTTPDWQLCGTGDYNADKQSDLLWQNLLTGETRTWLMNGTTVSSQVSLGTVTLDWFIRN